MNGLEVVKAEVRVGLRAPTRNLTDYQVHRKRIVDPLVHPANPNDFPRNQDLVLDHLRRRAITEKMKCINEKGITNWETHF